MCRPTRQTVPSGTAAVRYYYTINLLYVFCRNEDNLWSEMQCVGESTTVGQSGITAWRQNKDAAPCPAFVQGAPGRRAFLGVTLLPPTPPKFPGGRRTDGRQLDTVNNWTHTHTRRPAPSACPSCALLRNKEPPYFTSLTVPFTSY